MEINQVPFAQKLELTKTCIFQRHMHVILSKCVFELCEVTLNPKQQPLVQRQTEQWKGKIKINK